MAETTKLIHDLSCVCKQRAEGLGLKGAKRNDMALDFFLGAGTALWLLANDMLDLADQQGVQNASEHIHLVAVMAVASRGYSEVEALASPLCTVTPNPYWKE